MYSSSEPVCGKKARRKAASVGPVRPSSSTSHHSSREHHPAPEGGCAITAASRVEGVRARATSPSSTLARMGDARIFPSPSSARDARDAIARARSDPS